MTIHVNIKNLDTRANAIVEVLSTDTYHERDRHNNLVPTKVFARSEAILKGGEEVDVYVTSTMTLQVIERQNG